jgi:hypothetical protein
MAARLHALTVLASDPEVLASFWGDLLGWERSGLDLLPDADAPMRLSFEAADLPRARLNQVHFHLTSYTASQEANVARVLELGGSHLDVGQLPDENQRFDIVVVGGDLESEMTRLVTLGARRLGPPGPARSSWPTPTAPGSG